MKVTGSKDAADAFRIFWPAYDHIEFSYMLMMNRQKVIITFNDRFLNASNLKIFQILSYSINRQFATNSLYIADKIVAFLFGELILIQCFSQEIHFSEIGDLIFITVTGYVFQVTAGQDVFIEFAIGHTGTFSFSKGLD